MNDILNLRETMAGALGRLHRDERGQGMTEYVIILVAIAVVCIAIAVQFGAEIKALFETADVELGTVDDNMDP